HPLPKVVVSITNLERDLFKQWPRFGGDRAEVGQRIEKTVYLVAVHRFYVSQPVKESLQHDWGRELLILHEGDSGLEAVRITAADQHRDLLHEVRTARQDRLCEWRRPVDALGECNQLVKRRLVGQAQADLRLRKGSQLFPQTGWRRLYRIPHLNQPVS